MLHSFNGKGRAILLCLATALATGAAATSAATLELYVDANTKQVFTEPGPGRTKLGTFQAVDSTAPAEPQHTAGELQARQDAYEKKIDAKLAQQSANVAVGKKGLEVSSSDGDFSINLGGRMHIDAATQSGDDDFSKGATAGTEIRRGRIALKGTLQKEYKFHLEMDFAGDGVAMKDTLVTYTGFDGYELTVGNQKHAISMELEESSNDILFIERSLLSALTTPSFDRALGINLKTKGDNWSLQGGLYGDGIADGSKNQDEGGGWALRGTYAPLLNSNQVIHLGASLGQRKSTDDNSLTNSKTPRLRYETTHISDLYLSDTAALDGFESITLAGLEGAFMQGPLSLQGEYGQAYIDRDVGEELQFDAYYLQAAWTLTGESRTYKGSDGEFKGLKPATHFNPDRGDWGAWEVALRFDQLDLTDADILGGEQKRVSLALNWYLNENLRIMLNYIRAFDIDGGPVTKLDGSEPDDMDIVQLRTQIAF